MDSQLEIWSKTVPGWVWNGGIIISAILIGLAFKFIITGLMRYAKKTDDYSFFRSALTHLSGPLNYFVPLITLNALIPLLTFADVFVIKVSKLLEMLLIISFTNLLINTIKIFEDYVYSKYDLNKADNLKERKVRTQLTFIRKLIVVIIVLIAVSAILLSFESVRKIGTGLLTGVGISSIIVGFAAQNSLGNLLAGFQIAFTQPIRIDDVLVVEGEWGRVEDITLTYVVLSIWDQRRLILPINYFIQKPFQNWTRTTSEILGTVFLYVDYTFPVDDLRTEFTRLLNTTPLWDKRVSVLQVTDAKEKTIELRALMSAQNSSQAFDLRCYIRENLIKFIQQNHTENLPVNRLIVMPSAEKLIAPLVEKPDH